MSASRSGTRSTSISIPTPPLEAISPGRRGEPGGAEVLERDQQARAEQLEAALEQLRLLERVADLDRRALRVVAALELGRGEHRGAADPVAPGRGAHQDDRVADPGGGGADHLVGAREADAHRVDQAVLLVGRLEVDLAADRRHPDRVAVVADPGDDVVEQVARALRVELAEAQRVEDRDRPGAEREHVAEDPADPGRGALERLDRARVVVRLDLEGDRPAVADRDRPGVLARPHQHPLALGRQPAQQLARVLVGAVLGPQQAEHRQLDVVRLAAELLDDQLELGVGEPELAVLGNGDRQLAGRGVSAVSRLCTSAFIAAPPPRHRRAARVEIRQMARSARMRLAAPILLSLGLTIPRRRRGGHPRRGRRRRRPSSRPPATTASCSTHGADRPQGGSPRPGGDAASPLTASSRSRRATGCASAARCRCRRPASSPGRAASARTTRSTRP